MNNHWRIHIELSPRPGGPRGEEFYLDATEFDLESVLEERDATKRAVLRLLNVSPGEDESLDEHLRATARDRGDALLERLFWDDCINASVTFSGRPGAPEFERAEGPVDSARRELLAVKHGVEFGRVLKR